MENIKPIVFISYGRPNLEQARAVYEWLTRGGLTCWMDEKSLRTGQVWRQEIAKAIRECEIFIACLSKKSVSRRGFFQNELRSAYEELRNIPPSQPFLLPVRLDDCEIPSEIEGVHYIDFFTPEGPTRLLQDILHYLAPNLPALRLSNALEHIRLNRLDEALHELKDLYALTDDRVPDHRLRIIYDLACVESRRAERFSSDSKQRSSSLDAAFCYLGEWFDYGASGAWLRTWRTAQNEVYRMGCDSDLLYLLKSYNVKIREMLGDHATALPKDIVTRSKPSEQSYFGGGCLLLNEKIECPDGLLALENLRVGTTITSCELKSPCAPIESRVVRTYSSRESECVVINDKFIVTLSQPFFDIDNRVIRAIELRAENGDRQRFLDFSVSSDKSNGRKRGQARL